MGYERIQIKKFLRSLNSRLEVVVRERLERISAVGFPFSFRFAAAHREMRGNFRQSTHDSTIFSLRKAIESKNARLPIGLRFPICRAYHRRSPGAGGFRPLRPTVDAAQGGARGSACAASAASIPLSRRQSSLGEAGDTWASVRVSLAHLAGVRARPRIDRQRFQPTNYHIGTRRLRSISLPSGFTGQVAKHSARRWRYCATLGSRPMVDLLQNPPAARQYLPCPVRLVLFSAGKVAGRSCSFYPFQPRTPSQQRSTPRPQPIRLPLSSYLGRYRRSHRRRR